MSVVPTLVLTLALSALQPPAPAAIDGQESLTRIVDAFYSSQTLDETAAYEVKDLTITRDIATFKLTSGVLYVTKPIEGLTTSAVFIGQGTATVRPVRAMDSKCLDLTMKQHLGKKPGGQLSASFSEMFLMGVDGGLGGVKNSLTTKAASPDFPRAATVLRDRVAVLTTQEIGFDLGFAEKLAGLEEAALYIDFKTSDYGWLTFAYYPRSQVEVYLVSRERVGMFYDTHPYIVTHKLADFDTRGDYAADPVEDVKPLVDVKSYKMEITIPDTNHFLVEGDVTFSPMVDPLPIVEFDILNNIAGAKTTERAKPIYVTKITDGTGAALPFLHRKNTLLILPNEPLRKGQEYTYHFSLDEQTIIQLSSVHYLVLNTYPWFPQHGYNGGIYSMDWTIKAKKPLYATGSGRIVEERSEGAFNITRLLFEKEVQFPSLIFGQYQKATDAYSPKEGTAAVDLAVFSWPSASFTITDPDIIAALTRGKTTPITFDLVVPGGKPKNVLAEAKEIIKFAEALYGPFPFDSLNVAEMSPFMGFGQAPPGLVQLTGEAFMNPAAEVKVGNELLDFSVLKLDFFHEFFAHEVSHQWFGHALVWGTDEDQWLSEAFAEYSAGLYVMQLLGQERFQGKLKEWRDGARIADAYAPIAWANNLSGQSAGVMRTHLIYDKGPYVVHMLRMQVGHEAFTKGIRNTIEKYRHKPITTDHLRRELEAVAGYKLDYFFDQWFRNTGIPTLDYTSSVSQTEDGKWLATVKMSQRDKDHPKILSVPVFFHFGKDKVVVKNRPVLKADDVYQIKLPEKPESITLDDYRTLLADIVAQGQAAGS